MVEKAIETHFVDHGEKCMLLLIPIGNSSLYLRLLELMEFRGTWQRGEDTASDT